MKLIEIWHSMCTQCVHSMPSQSICVLSSQFLFKNNDEIHPIRLLVLYIILYHEIMLLTEQTCNERNSKHLLFGQECSTSAHQRNLSSETENTMNFYFGFCFGHCRTCIMQTHLMKQVLVITSIQYVI